MLSRDRGLRRAGDLPGLLSGAEAGRWSPRSPRGSRLCRLHLPALGLRSEQPAEAGPLGAPGPRCPHRPELAFCLANQPSPLTRQPLGWSWTLSCPQSLFPTKARSPVLGAQLWPLACLLPPSSRSSPSAGFLPGPFSARFHPLSTLSEAPLVLFTPASLRLLLTHFADSPSLCPSSPASVPHLLHPASR